MAKELHLKLLSRNKKAYAVFKCKECTSTMSGVVSPNGEVVCKKCSRQTKVPAELIRVDYKCCNCNTKGYLYTEKGIIDSTKCRDCQSPIDLFFIEKLGLYQSAGYRR